MLALFSLLLVIFWLAIKERNKTKTEIHSTNITALTLLIHIVDVHTYMYICMYVYISIYFFFFTLTLLALLRCWENLLQHFECNMTSGRSTALSRIQQCTPNHIRIRAYVHTYTHFYICTEHLISLCLCVQFHRSYPPSICCSAVCGLSAADPFMPTIRLQIPTDLHTRILCHFVDELIR